MSTYTPENMPGIQVEFIQTEPGIPATRWEPEMFPEIEIVDVLVNDQEISPDLSAHLLETLGDTWESDIVQKLRNREQRRTA